MTSLVTGALSAGVLRLTLDDPSSRNSLSQAMMTTLKAALAEAEADAAIRVIVIAAQGPVFCSGHNLKEINAHRGDADRGRDFFAALMAQCSALFLAIVHCPKPVIAEVAGPATAAGCQLAASCDLAIASEEASFATPGVNIGLFCSTPMVALSRNVPRKVAMEMLLTGDPVNARAAQAMGLVNRVVAREELRATVDQLAASIAQRSQLTVKIGKTAFYAQAEMPLEEAYAYAAAVMTENLLARDAEEGIAAFLEKRSAQWEDR